MRLQGKVAVVTGGASGIGEALVRRFVAEGAAGVLVADIAGEAAQRLADELSAEDAPVVACTTDVSHRAEVEAMIELARSELGPVDLLCSNAGIASRAGRDENWSRSWAVNVMSHVYGAEAVLPQMLERGSGYLLHTCSAAGLLTQPGDAPYAVTKAAAVAYAEWLAVTYGARGIGVSALCPQGVRTPMLEMGMEAGDIAARAVDVAGEILEPEQVADVVVQGLEAERFLVLPHPEVATYVQYKAGDPDRWIAGVRRLTGG